MEQWQLQQRRGLPLQAKITASKLRISEFYDYFEGNVYISFSGGLDSTVLAHMAMEIYPEIPLVFVDTGLEYPGIREQVNRFKELGGNVITLTPEKNFRRVIKEDGYPVVSKRVSRYVWDLRRPEGANDATKRLRLTGITREGQPCPSGKLALKWRPLVQAPFKISNACCDIMKKKPFKAYEKETRRVRITGEVAEECRDREKDYLKYGCNVFKSENPRSKPIGFWRHQDILEYINTYKVPYADTYGEILRDDEGKLYTTKEQRTGCMFCMFGVHMEQQPNRFQRMQTEYPKQYEYCINNLGLGQVLDTIGVPYHGQMSFEEIYGN